MLPVNEGGYSDILGWTGDKDDKPKLIPASKTSEEQTPDANDDDKDAQKTGAWQTIAEHTCKVVESLKNLIQAFPCLDEKSLEALRIAARWHDAGKAHEVFQKAANNASPRGHEHCGKSPRMSPYERPGFRHELASALAMLQQGLPDLSAYLAAAHHGKVRLSIRSLPNEKPDTDKRFARGLFDGDQLPETNLGGGVVMPQTDIDLSYMEMGEGPRGDSWVARALSLRDSPDLGPFRLAFLETLLRVADWRASKGEEQ